MDGTYRFDDVRVDTAAARVFKGDDPVALEPRGYDLLCFLVRNPGRLVEKRELLQAVWGETFVSENAMTRAVAHLRRALGDDARESRYLETVPTRGYRFIAPVHNPTDRPEAGPAPPAPAISAAAGAAPRSRWGAAVTGAVGLLVGAGLATGLLDGLGLERDAAAALRAGDAPRLALSRLSLPLEPVRVALGFPGTLDVTADGRTVAFLGWRAEDEDAVIFLRGLHEETPRALAGTSGARQIVFSPDGRWVGFLTHGGIQRVPVGGGPPESLAPLPGPPPLGGFCFGEDGSLYASNGGRILRLDRDGSQVISSPDAERGEQWLGLPRSMPGLPALLVTVRLGDGDDEARIDLLHLDDGRREPLIPTGYDARLAGEHVLFAWNGMLMAVAFDRERLQVSGQPFTVLEGVLSHTGKGVAQYAASQRGTLFYLPRIGELRWRLVWVDRAGRERPALEAEFSYRDPAVSPDGRRLAFRDTGADQPDIWLYDRGSRALSRLGVGGRTAAIVWSPDGTHIAFAQADYAGGYDVFWKRVGSDQPAAQLTHGPAREFPKAISPDGARLVVERENDWSDHDLIAISLAEPGGEQLLLGGRADQREPAWSPDGRWLAFQSNRTGRYQLYLIDPKRPGREWQVSSAGGREPLWTRGGAELLFRRGTALVSVAVSGGAEPNFGEERVLFEREQLRPGPGYRNYAATPDGSELLMVAIEGVPRQGSIDVLLDWPALSGAAGR